MPRGRFPITDAALRLGETYQQVRTKLLRGELKGGRDEFGRLYVDATCLRRVRRLAPLKRRRKGHRNG